MELQAIIVEDEAKSREILRNYITKYCPKVILKGEAANIDEALVLIRNHKLDLVFLDVEMPFGNAFDLLEQVGDRSFETVFVTAYDHYALDALNNHASYYLLKPIAIDELIKAIDYVYDIKLKESELENSVVAAKTPSMTMGKITVPQQDGFRVIEIKDILYCKADDNYTEIHLEKSKILVSKTLKHFDELLKDANFVRIHKSYLVNVNSIVKYRKGKGGSVVLSTDKEIHVAPSKKAELLSYFK